MGSYPTFSSKKTPVFLEKDYTSGPFPWFCLRCSSSIVTSILLLILALGVMPVGESQTGEQNNAATSKAIPKLQAAAVTNELRAVEADAMFRILFNGSKEIGFKLDHPLR